MCKVMEGEVGTVGSIERKSKLYLVTLADRKQYAVPSLGFLA